MRADVKVGVVLGLAVLAVLGWYVLRPEDAQPIPVVDANMGGAVGSPGQGALPPPIFQTAESKRHVSPPETGERKSPARQIKPSPRPDPSKKLPTTRRAARAKSPTTVPAQLAKAAAGANRPLGGAASAASEVKGPTRKTPSRKTEKGPRAQLPLVVPPPKGAAGTVKTPSAAEKLKGLEEKLRPSLRTGGEERQARSKRRLGPKPEEKTRTHVVEQFDTFSELSAKYYGTQRYATLLWKANPQVPDARRLKLGMELRIPPLGELTGSGGPKAETGKSRDAKPGPAKRADEVKVYVVKPNDSFYAIAEKVWGSGARWRELLALNKDICPSPERLKPGMKLRLEALKPKPRAKKPARSATPTTRARPKAKRSKEPKPVG